MDKFEDAKNFFLIGLKYFENEEFIDAEINFLNSLKLVPNRASILINLSVTQIKLKKFEEAEVNLRILEKIDDKSFPAASVRLTNIFVAEA